MIEFDSDSDIFTSRQSCRICGYSERVPLYSFGDHYVNDFPAPGEETIGKIPIDIDYCPKCTLVQQRHTPDSNILYSDHYWYRSGTTRTMYEALRDIVEDAQSLVTLDHGDIVLDIGSNDGTLLRHYPDHVSKVGFEPAGNLVQEGSEGVDILVNELWDGKLYRRCMKRQKAKVITAIGMFYDLDDPNQFIKDIADCLSDDGIFIAQLMCLQNMIEMQDVGNFAHEHLEFYSFSSLQYLFYRNGLEIIDVERNNVNGGSYRLYARRTSVTADSVIPREGAGERIQRAIDLEDSADPIKRYSKFFQSLEDNKSKVMFYLDYLKNQGKKLWIYGASTKGNTILQYYGIGPELIEAAAEKSKEKWGKQTLTGIPIVSEAEARKADPDYFLVLPYAFIDEFIQREQDWISRGGRFIVPIPRLKVMP